MCNQNLGDLSRYLDDPAQWQAVSAALRQVARGILGDEAAAEDVVQGAWLEALGRPQQSVGFGWLKKLVRSRSIDQLRSRRRESQRNAKSTQGAAPHGSEDLAPKLEAQRLVIQAVESLKEPYQSTIYLRYFEGLTPKEIAKRMGVPEATTKSRLTRAHHSLREQLGRRLKDGRGHWAPAVIAFSGLPTSAPAPVLVATGSLLLMKKTLLVLGALGAMALAPLLFWQSEFESTGLEQESPSTALVQEPTIQSNPIGQDAGRSPVAVASPGSETGVEVVQAFPVQPPEEAAGLDLLLRWPDGTPAQGVEIAVLPWGAPNPHIRKQVGFSDRFGAANFEQLNPGTMGIYLDRGTYERCSIGAGERKVLQITLAEGYSLEGRVLDPKGSPVPGATVLVSNSKNGRQGNELSKADATGYYRVRHISGYAQLSARAPGYSPSAQYVAHGKAGVKGVLDLVLRGPGGAISGVVLSPEGTPVANALVQVRESKPKNWEAFLDSNIGGQRPLAMLLRSDDQGEFLVPDAGAGQVSLAVRTELWAGWRHTLFVTAGKTEHVVAQLADGFPLTGTIRRANGEPAAAAEVTIGDRSSILVHATQCDDQGEYRIEGLQEGSQRIHADLENVGSVGGTIEVDSGTPARWDATLTEGGRASGTLLDENGQPLANWIVGWHLGKGLWDCDARTDPDGRFVLEEIQKVQRDLHVAPPDGYSTGVCWVEKDVLPAKSDLTIVVPGRAIPSASLDFRLQFDGQGEPVSASARLRGLYGYANLQESSDAQGRVHFSGLRTNAYVLEIEASGYPKVVRRVSLEHGQKKDLGVIPMQEGGKVAVELVGAYAGKVRQVIVVDEEDRILSFFGLRKGKGTSDLLVSGPVRLRISGERVAHLLLEGQVQAGTTTLLRATPEPGTFRSFTIERKDMGPLEEGTTALVRSASGQVLYLDEDITSGRLERNSVPLHAAGLTLGSYEIVLESPSGDLLEHAFQVRNLKNSTGSGKTLQMGD